MFQNKLALKTGGANSRINIGPTLVVTFEKEGNRVIHHDWRTCVIKQAQAQQKVMKAAPGA